MVKQVGNIEECLATRSRARRLTGGCCLARPIGLSGRPRLAAEPPRGQASAQQNRMVVALFGTPNLIDGRIIAAKARPVSPARC